MTTFCNRTRTSRSIPKSLLQQGKWYLLPLYYLLRTSELAREGIENSGSYQFAEHVYRQKPKGKYGIGYLLDAILLRLPSARSMKSRHVYAIAEIKKYLSARRNTPTSLLSVPCGYASEFFTCAEIFSDPCFSWHGIDLDNDLVDGLRRKSIPNTFFLAGDALRQDTYLQKYHFIMSTGFTEFLNDRRTLEFFQLVYDQLESGGKFYTSSMLPHPVSDFLLRNIAEIYTCYRSEDELRQLVKAAGFSKIDTYHDETGLQTILLAEKQ